MYPTLKKITLALLMMLCTMASVQAQLGTTVSVQGNQILGPCGDTLLLRGINYAAYNWGWSPGQLFLDQIAQSGANCVRIPWYQTPAQGTPQSTYGDLVNLDSVLSQCIQNQLIPILELHDLTCQNDTAALLSLANWYTQPAVLTLIDKYKHSIILNISNEVLYVNWTGNPAAAQATFVNTYSAISQTLRSAGITVPLMVDGPDCGQNLDVLASVGPILQQNDPAQNTIFSAHAYWYGFAANDSTTMAAKIDNAIASGIPFVLGEIANLQDDQTMCQYTLHYQSLLRICQVRNVPWFAWSWDNDGCQDRQISTNGSISSLTPYGDDILNNIDYGIHNFSPARSQYLFNGGSCNTPTQVAVAAAPATLRISPNPNQGDFEIAFGQQPMQGVVRVTDLAGRLVHAQAFAQANRVHMQLDVPAGMYVATVLVDGRPIGSIKISKQ
jgi:mannan endo-1,4-beta-mannosidase